MEGENILAVGIILELAAVCSDPLCRWQAYGNAGKYFQYHSFFIVMLNLLMIHITELPG